MGPHTESTLVRLARSLRQGTTDMLDMVDSLMDMTRMEAGQLVVDAEAMRLPPLLERVVDHMLPMARQKEILLGTAIPVESSITCFRQRNRTLALVLIRPLSF